MEREEQTRSADRRLWKREREVNARWDQLSDEEVDRLKRKAEREWQRVDRKKEDGLTKKLILHCCLQK